MLNDGERERVRVREIKGMLYKNCKMYFYMPITLHTDCTKTAVNILSNDATVL